MATSPFHALYKTQEPVPRFSFGLSMALKNGRCSMQVTWGSKTAVFCSHQRVYSFPDPSIVQSRNPNDSAGRMSAHRKNRSTCDHTNCLVFEFSDSTATYKVRILFSFKFIYFSSMVPIRRYHNMMQYGANKVIHNITQCGANKEIPRYTTIWYGAGRA